MAYRRFRYPETETGPAQLRRGGPRPPGVSQVSQLSQGADRFSTICRPSVIGGSASRMAGRVLRHLRQLRQLQLLVAPGRRKPAFRLSRMRVRNSATALRQFRHLRRNSLDSTRVSQLSQLSQPLTRQTHHSMSGPRSSSTRRALRGSGRKDLPTSTLPARRPATRENAGASSSTMVAGFWIVGRIRRRRAAGPRPMSSVFTRSHQQQDTTAWAWSP